MDLVDFKSCQERLRETRLGADFILHKSFLCGGGTKDVDTCTGDGGGPLVCPTSNDSSAYIQVTFLLSVNSCENANAYSDNLFVLLLFQVGITSWGIGCYDDIPGVYADVTKATCFIDWASKCVEGPDVNHFNFSNTCSDDWAKSTYCDIKTTIADLQNKVILRYPAFGIISISNSGNFVFLSQ